MFGHRSFLVIGGGAADIVSLVKGGYEILDCNFSFEQGVDRKGKATTKVRSGIFDIKLSQIPQIEHIEWALNSRKYSDGVIVLLDADNLPVEKFLFQNATCIRFSIDYTLNDNSYLCTKMTICAEKVIVGNGIEFDNEWVLD